MKKRIVTRLLVLFVVAAGCLYLVASRSIPLGLDLRGGVQVVLRVLVEDAIRAETESILQTIRQDIVKGDGPSATAVDMGEIEFHGIPVSDLTGRFPGWEVIASAAPGGTPGRLRMTPAHRQALSDSATMQTIHVIENRLNDFGVNEIAIQRYGALDDYQVQIQAPGLSGTQEIQQLIQTTGLLEFRIVDRGPFPGMSAARLSYGPALPADLELLPVREEGEPGAYYAVRRDASLTGRHLRTAMSSRDPLGRPAVGFTANPEGARRFGEMTEKNIGKDLAIVLDGIVQSVARIESKIERDGIIQGGSEGFTPDQVRNLVVILRAGAFPARAMPVQEQFIGPALGEDSIRAGIAASVAALVAVSALVIGYYRKAGVNATVAMLFNLLILLGAMAYLGATLTLAGIAGIVLTIGVGIDSNVLIFERIREELRGGQNPGAAITTGFKRVLRTLFDTHLAAMISAAILFMFSSGPVRGFAVSLAIGLVSNLFTSIFVSRTLFNLVRTKDQMSI